MTESITEITEITEITRERRQAVYAFAEAAEELDLIRRFLSAYPEAAGFLNPVIDAIHCDVIDATERIRVNFELLPAEFKNSSYDFQVAADAEVAARNEIREIIFDFFKSEKLPRPWELAFLFVECCARPNISRPLRVSEAFLNVYDEALNV